MNLVFLIVYQCTKYTNYMLRDALAGNIQLALAGANAVSCST